MVYRWNVPDEIEKHIEISSLSNEQVIYYHDQMHVFWEKILEGQYFGQSSDDGWTFYDVYKTHREVVIEMMKRKIKHIHPINPLDEVAFANNTEELMKLINSIKE